MNETVRILNSTIEVEEAKKAKINKFWRDPNFKIEIDGEALTLKENATRAVIQAKEIFEKTKEVANEEVPEGKFILYVNATYKGLMGSGDIKYVDKDRLMYVNEEDTGYKELEDGENFLDANMRYCLGFEKGDSRFKVFHGFDPDEVAPDLTDCVGVVFSGSEANVLEESIPARIEMTDKIRNLIKKSKVENIPKLGLCFGGQLLSNEEGLEIGWVKDKKGEERVAGMQTIKLTNLGKSDQLSKDFPEDIQIAQNHGQEIRFTNDSKGTVLATFLPTGAAEIINFENSNTIVFQGHIEVGKNKLSMGTSITEEDKYPENIARIYQENPVKMREAVFPIFLKSVGEYIKKQ
ncbi:MAG: hypothetical protein AAB438_02640 [Patescibacteria group bacterium]